MQRKFNRDSLRKIVGNKNLGSAWRRFQMKKYKHNYKEVCKIGGGK